MYPNYFGLSEASFSITPDPQYLFLSEQHREALAHLLYGAGDSGGFVLLTGEVGTGKTTVCRAFLEQLPEAVDVALVLNPAMTAVELLHAICDEFRVQVPASEQSAKALVDRLNGFLLEAHAAGRRPVLIIDEAQNLRPKVMEQIRLLTNLETTKHKLLQIFLIGQPELRALLASPDLRQLNQRITARFHLKPLGARETAAYIDHRIAVAGVDRPLFTGSALRRVYRCTGGVPRLINLVCDRALLGAAVSRQLQVTPQVVSRAAREIHGADDGALPRRGRGLAIALSVVLACLLGIWLGQLGLVERLPGMLADWHAGSPGPSDPGHDPQDPGLQALVAYEPPGRGAGVEPMAPAAEAAEPVPAVPVAQGQGSAPNASAPAPDAVDGPPPASADAPLPRVATARLVPVLDAADTGTMTDQLAALLVPETQAVDALLRLWGIAPDAADEGLDCEAVTAFGLACERSNGRWSELRMFDRPVALPLRLADGRRGHAIVSALDAEHATLHGRGDRARVPIAELDQRWSGDYLLLWQLPPDGERVIGRSAGADVVAWLRRRLAALPGAGLEAEPARYDAALTAAIRRFQSEQGLAADGIAGPRTLILLNNAQAVADVPRLRGQL